MKLTEYVRALVNELADMRELRSSLGSEIQALREEVDRLVQVNVRPDLAWCNALLFCETEIPYKDNLGGVERTEITMLSGTSGLWLHPDESGSVSLVPQQTLRIATIGALGPCVVSQAFVGHELIFQGEAPIVHLSGPMRPLALVASTVSVQLKRLPR